MTGDRDDRSDALINGGQNRCLPAATGETGHGEAVGVCVLVGEEQVQAPLHGEVHYADSGDSTQIDVALAHVIGCALQFAHPNELGIQGEHPTLCEIDAAGLLVGHGFAAAVVSVGIQHCWHFALQLGGLVEKRGNPHARIAFVTELSDSVAFVCLDHSTPLDFGFGVQSVMPMAFEIDLGEEFFAEAFGPLFPLFGRLGDLKPGQLLPKVIHHEAGVILTQQILRERAGYLFGSE